ncbi:MAG: hypothetical protein ACPGYV_09295 [Phycisphaeraceae bacterium]
MTTNCAWVLLCCGLLLVCFPVSAEDAIEGQAVDEAQRFVVEPVLIKVGRKFEGVDDRDAFRLGLEPGTQVTLMLTSPRLSILPRPRSMSIDAFEDDAGNSLIVEEKDPIILVQGAMNWNPSLEASRLVSLRVYGRGTPAKDAKAIHLRGTMRFMTASESQWHEHDNVGLTVGNKVNAGPVTCEITRVRQRGQVDEPKRWTRVTLQFDETWPELAEVEFRDADGRRIKKVHINQSIGYGEDKRLRKRLTYDIETLEHSATVKFRLWTDMQEVEAPIDLTIGLDLGGRATF